MKLKLLKRTGASAIALAAATLGASASFAASSQDRAILDAISFETQHKNLVIRVITTDGKRWDAIAEENIPFDARSVIDTAGNGVIHNVGVTLGACAGLSCQGAPIVMSAATLKRDLDRTDNLAFSTNLIPISTPEEKASIPLGDQLLSRCNEKVTDAGAVTSHAFYHDAPVTLVADTSRTNGPLAAYDPAPNLSGDAVVHADFARTNALKVRIVCDAGDGLAQDLMDGHEGEDVVAGGPHPVDHDGGTGGGPIPVEPDGGPGAPVGDPDLPGGEGPPFDPGFPVPPVGDPWPNPLKVHGTLSLHETSANPGQTKPRLGKAFFRIYTNKPGLTKWKLSCTGGRNWIGTSPTVQADANVWRFFKAVNFQINKTELVKCKLRTRSLPGHPKLAEAKRLYKVLPGDLADPGGPLAVKGMLDLREFANTDKTKPRSAYAKFSILVNKPGKTRWKLTCSKNRYFQGNSSTKKIGAKTWRVTIKRTFNISQTELVSCALRSKTAANKLLDTDKRLYKVGPNGGGGNGGGGGGGFGGPGNLVGSVQLMDLKKIAIPRSVRLRFSLRSTKRARAAWRLSCSNGKTWSGRTLLKLASKKKYRATMTRKFRVSRTQTVHCSLRVRGRKIASDTHKYNVRGKRPVAGGGGVINKPGKPARPSRPIVGSIKPKCVGGTVVSTKRLPPQLICACPQNKKKRKIGRNAYKCFPKFAKQKRPNKVVSKPRPSKKQKELRNKRKQQLIQKRRVKAEALRKARQERALKVRQATN